MQKHLDRSPSIMKCELFGYALNLVPSKTSVGEGQSFINCFPRPRGQGAVTAVNGPRHPQRVIHARDPDEVVG